MDGEQDVTRRDFLKAASAATGALALSHIGNTSLLGSPPPSDVVRYGVIGTGTQGCNLLRFLSTMAEGRCIATCDIYPPNLKKGIETIGSNPQTYQDYRQLLDRKDLDAVLICTPLNLHAPMVIAALDAGKHVFVEACMFLKEPEGEQLRKTAEAHPKQVLQVGLQRRSSALYKVAMQMVRKGAVGRVLFVRAQWHLNSDWRRPVPDAQHERLINWRMYREFSGGLLAEFSSHQIDVANWVIDADPVSVVATGGINYWKDGRETCDNAQAILEYPGGEKLSLSTLLFNGHFGFDEQILGDQGTLIISIGKGLYFREKLPKVSSAASKENWKAGATIIAAISDNGVPIFPEKITPTEPFLDREVKYAKRWLASMGIYEYAEPHDPWYSEMANFFASIREGKSVSAPLDLGISAAQSVIYANRAIDTGQRIFWPKGQG